MDWLKHCASQSIVFESTVFTAMGDEGKMGTVYTPQEQPQPRGVGIEGGTDVLLLPILTRWDRRAETSN